MKAATVMILPAAIFVSMMMFAVVSGSGTERREAALVPHAVPGPAFQTADWTPDDDLAPVEDGFTPVFLPVRDKIVEVNSHHVDVN